MGGVTVSSAAPRSQGVTADDIADAALAIVEREGAEQLTMRKLAAELGVTSTTIYWHVGGRDEVLAAALERFAARVVPGEPQGETPRQRVLSVLRGIWRKGIEHPNVARLAYSAGHIATTELPWQEALARELTAAGLSGPDAADAMRGLLYAVGGFIVVRHLADAPTPGTRTSADAWSGADTSGIDPGLVEQLACPPDFEALFDRTFGALVDAVVPG